MLKSLKRIAYNIEFKQINLINSSFKELQSKANELARYDIINICVTSPLDGNEKNVLFKKLVEKMEKEIDNKKQEVIDSKQEVSDLKTEKSND